MADYLARIWEFITTVSVQYVAWVSAVLFTVDQILSRNFWSKDALELADRILPEGNRHRLFKWLALVGFLFASFQAFDHANQDLKRVSAEALTSKTDLSTKTSELDAAQQALAGTRRQLAEAKAKIAQAPPIPIAEQPKAAFDLDDDAEVKAKIIQSCGDMTIVRGRGSSKLDLQNGSFVAPNAVCQFPPPTEEMKRLSNKGLKERIAKLSEELQAFKAKADSQIDYKMRDSERRALEQKSRDEFKGLYLERGAALASAVLARIDGPIEIREPADNNMQGTTWAFATRLGRSSLYFGKPIGIDYAGNVDSYLKFIAAKLPE